jgi:general secretion pathway protein L
MRLNRFTFAELRAAWQWWTGELLGIVPRRWRERLAGSRGGLVVVLTGHDRAELRQRGPGREEKLTRLNLALSRIAETRETLALVRQRGVAATIRLPPAAGLSVMMILPAAAETNLDQVVSFELDRRTPFKREEVYHRQRVAERLDGGKRISVQLTVVPRREVDGALALARVLGLALDRIEVAGQEASNFLPAQSGLLPSRSPPLLVGGLMLATAILAGLAVFTPLQRAHRTLATLQQTLATVKERADESMRLQKQVDAAIQESGFLAARKRQVPVASEVLNALTHLLPDDTWLSELEIAKSEVHINGYAASASAILSLVDQSQRFFAAAYRSPVVQDLQANREQFNIAARIAEVGQ